MSLFNFTRIINPIEYLITNNQQIKLHYFIINVKISLILNQNFYIIISLIQSCVNWIKTYLANFSYLLFKFKI